MSAQFTTPRIAKRRIPTLVLLVLLGSISVITSACTREDMASAVATVIVDLQATLEPLSATVEAGRFLQDLPTREAVEETGASGIIANILKASPTGIAEQPTLTLPAQLEPTAVPSTPLPQPSNTPNPTATIPTATVPTATAVPSPTPEPSVTPIPSPTPLPLEIQQGNTVMVLVSGGFFQMGAAAADMLAECETFRSGCDESWFTAGEPVHTVLVAPFYVDQYEVSNLSYLDFLNDGGTDIEDCAGQTCLVLEQSEIQSASPGGYQVGPEQALNPVSGVSWFGAAAYCEWRGSRLPTEAEWEKAALWNPTTEASTLYPWGDQFDGTRVNFCDINCDEPQANADFDDGFAEFAPVGSIPGGVSPFGAYDMAGNLWEWVSDWYGETYYADSPTNNPTGPEEGTSRVVRGGSWFDTGNFTSGRIRFPSEPDNSDRTIGFRCASSLR